MNDEEINAFVHDQHVKIHEVMTERIKAETLAEKRFSAAVAAFEALIPREFSMEGKFEECMKRLAGNAVIAADALLAALEEKK